MRWKNAGWVLKTYFYGGFGPTLCDSVVRDTLSYPLLPRGLLSTLFTIFSLAFIAQIRSSCNWLENVTTVISFNQHVFAS